ncbi:MAG: hypothetical protein ACT4OJ_04040 [Bacteroidota bacterium]
MKKTLLLILLANFTQLFLTGCSKTTDNSPVPAPPAPAKAVYAAGYHNKNGMYYTTIWKDGAANVIDSNATPLDIFVSGPDLYIVGQKNSKGILWKNGTGTQLQTDPAYGYVDASSIYVMGSDVHIAGFAENASTFRKQAVYWKNNVPVMLNAGANTEDSYAQSVFVSGTDVYVCGRKTIAGGGEAVVIWKNGLATDLVSSTTASYGNVNLYISGNDVYVTCYEYESPNPEQIRLWKNGTVVTVPSSVLGAVPYCLFVNGADVYIGGFEREGTPSSNYGVAKYWKNGTAVTASSSTTGSNIVRSIYVDGTDVYVAGVVGSVTSTTSPVIWKNGAAYPLTGIGANPNGEVLSVFVK